MDTTILESAYLPSKGLIYGEHINPEIQLRSMTTNEEMLRLTHSERQYKILCDIIDRCIVGEKPGISSYDMCLGDYQYLLHKLRVATYGNIYKLDTLCPICKTINTIEVDLDSFPVLSYSEDLDKYFKFTLPGCKKEIEIRLQTPRSIDDINIKVKEFKKNNKDSDIDPTLLYTIQSLIAKIDGMIPSPMQMDSFLRDMSMRDTNYILKCAEKLNAKVGRDTTLSVTCKGCGVDYDSPFRITPEFFGPEIDI